MAQIFHPAANVLSRAILFGALLAVAGLAWLAGQLMRSSYVTEARVIRNQPVPFSHAQHVGGVGLDCRYCHASAETTAFAGLPAAKTCMACHSQLWADAPMLEPVRRAAAGGPPVAWRRVNDLPDYVYFDHSIHLARGIGCATCDGRVDRMPLLSRHASLQMKWCLGCHRRPEQAVRPKEALFRADWEPPADGGAQGRELAHSYGVRRETDCSVCHR